MAEAQRDDAGGAGGTALLARHEEAIAALYNAYARRFRDYESFWSALATEEITHASWIDWLGEVAKSGRIFFNPGRFKREPVQTSMDYLRRQLSRVETEHVSFIEALSRALDTERGMIERKFFEAFDDDAPELRRVMRDLEQSTNEHIEKLAALRDANR